MDDSLQARKDLAVKLVGQNRLQEARDLYDQICAANESDAEAWFRLGAVTGMMGDLDRMVVCNQKAIALAPLLVSAYGNLAYGLLSQGKPTEAAQCYWTMAMNMYNDKRFDDAQRALSQFLEVPVSHSNEQLAQAHFNRGFCFMTLGNYSKAVKDFQKAVELQPDNPKHCGQLADSLVAMTRFEEACQIYHQLLRLVPDNAKVYVHIAEVYERMHRLDDAASYVKQALEHDPNDIAAIVSLARLQRRSGNLEAACDQLEAVRSGLSGPSEEPELYYELGRVYDRLERYADAFKTFRQGNEISSQSARAKEQYNIGVQYLEQLTIFQKSFTAERLAGWQVKKPKDNLPSPVFLVGHPRSGTTLTEQILSAHPATVVSNEQPIFTSIVSAIMDRVGVSERVPDYLDDISQEQLASLRAEYWDRAESILGVGARNKILIDKAPVNLKNLGIAQRIFPESSVIVALRDPRDVCLSCFMQHFIANGSTVHFYSFDQTALHYGALMGLWLHYRSVLELRWIESRYENLVVDFEVEARRLISFLNLEWDDTVLTYFKKTRHVSTPGYEAVASPIFSSAIGRWRNYHKELQPVLARLSRFVREFGYEE